MKRVFGLVGAVLAGAVATTMAASMPAGAAVLSTQTRDFAIQLTAVVENITGSGMPRLTVTGHQALAFDRIDPAQNLTGLTATFTARMPSYAFTVSQQGGGAAGSGIALAPVLNSVVASVMPGGSPVELADLEFVFTDTTLEVISCNFNLCVGTKNGSRDAKSVTKTFAAADLLALFEGSGEALVDIDIEQLFDLFYVTGSTPDPRFAYSYRFEFAGSLTLAFAGDGPNDPGEPGAVPEPLSAGLLLAGVAAALAARRRRP